MHPNCDQRTVQNVSKFLDTFWRYFLEMNDDRKLFIMCPNFWTLFCHIFYIFFQNVQNMSKEFLKYGHNRSSWTLYGHNLDTFWVWTHILDTFLVWTLFGYIFGHIMVTFCQNV